jgi:uncharacterized protein (DUF58 family)
VLSPELISEIKGLEIQARRLATDISSGDSTSAFHGRGMEFHEVRGYVPGDDVRSIDWNVTARTGTPHVKVFREERELTIVAAIDVSHSMFAGSGQPQVSAAKASKDLGMVLAWLSMKNSDRMGLVTFTDQIESFLPPKKNRMHTWRVIEDIQALNPKKPAASIKVVREYLDSVIKSRVRVFLISDFLSPHAISDLKYAGGRHDFTIVHVVSPYETLLPEAGVVRFRDSESGALCLIDTSDKVVREAYMRQNKERHQAIERQARRNGADFFKLMAGQSVVPPLANYLRMAQGFKRTSRGVR